MRVKMQRTHAIEHRDESGRLQAKTYYADGGEYNVDESFGSELIDSGAAVEVEQPDTTSAAPTTNSWQEV